WTPEPEDTSTALVAQRDLGQLLQSRNAVSAATLNNVRAVVAKTPGKSLAEALYEAGVDEATLQEAVAELAHLPFERIEPDAVEAHRHIERLGLDFCQKHGVLPLRTSGQRVVLGVTHPDALLLID